MSFYGGIIFSVLCMIPVLVLRRSTIARVACVAALMCVILTALDGVPARAYAAAACSIIPDSPSDDVMRGLFVAKNSMHEPLVALICPVLVLALLAVLPVKRESDRSRVSQIDGGSTADSTRP